MKFIEVTRDTATSGQSELSLAGLAKAVGMAPAIANLIPTAVLVGGVAGRRPPARPAELWRSRIAVATMTLGSPVVNINSYAMLLACLAPWVWPVRETVPSPTRPRPRATRSRAAAPLPA